MACPLTQYIWEENLEDVVGRKSLPWDPCVVFKGTSVIYWCIKFTGKTHYDMCCVDRNQDPGCCQLTSVASVSTGDIFVTEKTSTQIQHRFCTDAPTPMIFPGIWCVCWRSSGERFDAFRSRMLVFWYGPPSHRCMCPPTLYTHVWPKLGAVRIAGMSQTTGKAKRACPTWINPSLCHTLSTNNSD